MFLKILIISYWKIYFLSQSYLGCNVEITSPNIELTSPNFPETYPLNQICNQMIRFEAGERIRLEFLDFDLEPGTWDDGIISW